MIAGQKSDRRDGVPYGQVKNIVHSIAALCMHIISHFFQNVKSEQVSEHA